MDLPPEKQFHFHDGTSVASIDALQQKLQSISYQDFYRHVNPDKNDFASWIRHVFHEERLAEEMDQVTSIVETVEIINDFLHPRPATAPMTDIQSRIEETVFHGVPVATSQEAPMTVEDVPTTAPSVSNSNDRVDFHIIEENLGDEMSDGKSTTMPGKDATSSMHSSALSESSASSGSATTQNAEIPPALTPQDHARMIVKDFMYGLVFGLVIGFILGRIITF